MADSMSSDFWNDQIVSEILKKDLQSLAYIFLYTGCVNILLVTDKLRGFELLRIIYCAITFSLVFVYCKQI